MLPIMPINRPYSSCGQTSQKPQLVSVVRVDPVGFGATLLRIANKIADCGPLGKTTLASAHLDAQFGALFHTQDFLEGRKAEAEGRKPVYQGK